MKHHFETLAAYHAWASDALFDALEAIDNNTLHAPAGLFFDSMHGTLNHILVAEQLWFERIHGESPATAALDAELHADRVSLRAAIGAQNARWQHWIATVNEAAFGQVIRYRNLAGTPLSDPLSLVLTHIFNHATHHRGQISAAITATGAPPPAMDLIYFLRGSHAART